VAKLGETAIEFPPVQKGASFNLEAVKAQVKKVIAAHTHRVVHPCSAVNKRT
jgi:hypothetical protein